MMEKIQQHKPVIAAAAGITVVAAGTYLLLKSRERAPRSGPFGVDTLPAGAFDAVIVGAGPSGSTAAYYLARAGAKVMSLSIRYICKCQA